MKYISTYAIVGAILAVVGGPGAVAAPSTDQHRHASAQSNFMRIYGPSLPPFGYVAFCNNNPKECRRRRGSFRRPQLTPTRLLQLDDINRLVNESIEPVTDLEAYGVSEHWTLPASKGDCEDYALLKRRMLLARGWSQSAVLMTVVRDEFGDGHAVLTVRTAQGDYILDNKTSDILAWNKTPYRFVMRQSYLDPQNWMRLDRSPDGAPVKRSGSRK